MELMMNKQGEFALFDDTYDVVIHCDSKKARDEVIADLKAINDRLDTLDKIMAEILDEAEYASADFDKYKEDILDAEPDELPDDDFRYGLQRAVEIINKYKAEARNEE